MCNPVIQALSRQRQEGYEVNVSLGYIGNCCLKKTKTTTLACFKSFLHSFKDSGHLMEFIWKRMSITSFQYTDFFFFFGDRGLYSKLTSSCHVAEDKSLIHLPLPLKVWVTGYAMKPDFYVVWR